MQNTTQDRFQYHPDPDQLLSGVFSQSSLRRVDARKEAILNMVDLKDKSLLDLGCSGGYFGFSLSMDIKSYHGIDGDEVLISRNQESAKSRGLENLKFEHCQITPERIRHLPHFDVALFLSVFHHILAVSQAYEWNQENVWEPKEILTALAEKVNVLVFETGYPDEGHEWCERLPPMLPTPKVWVEELLHEAGFEHVEIISAPAHQGFIGRLRAGLGKSFNAQCQNRTLITRVISRIFRLDPRDGRDIFIARRT